MKKLSLLRIRATAKHHFVSLPPLFDQFGNQIRGVLHVCVDRNNSVALRPIEPRRQCRLLSEIATQMDCFYERVLSVLGFEQFQGFVGASVIYAYHFVMIRQTFEYRYYSLEKRRDVVFLVKHWNNYAHQLFFHNEILSGSIFFFTASRTIRPAFHRANEAHKYISGLRGMEYLGSD